MPYNVTNVTEANTYGEIVTRTNEATGGLYFAVVLLTLFLVILIVLKNYNTKAVLVGDSFAISVIAALLFFNNLIPWHILILPVLILFGSIMFLVFSGS